MDRSAAYMHDRELPATLLAVMQAVLLAPRVATLLGFVMRPRKQLVPGCAGATREVVRTTEQGFGRPCRPKTGGRSRTSRNPTVRPARAYQCGGIYGI
jgi:hypothetical protein